MPPDHPHGQPTELAALYVTGAMTPDERRRFDEHLATGCAACSAAIRRLASVAKALSLPEAGTDFSTSVEMAKIGESLAQDASGSVQVVRAGETAWQDTPFDGVAMRVLHVDRPRGQYTALIRMNPHAVCPEHQHREHSQCLVVEGDLYVGEHHLQPGDFAFTGAGVPHDARAGDQGCLACVIEPLN